MASAAIKGGTRIGASGHPLTDEQELIISCPPKGITKWQAFAGCAKTTTSVEYSHAHPESALYLAFNSAIEKDAKGRFPAHVQTRTAHGYAYGAMGVRQHSSRLVGRMRPEELARCDDIIRPIARMTELAVKRAIIKAVGNFVISGDDRIEIEHLTGFPGALRGSALSMVERVVERIMDFEGSGMSFTHDVYLKAFALRGQISDAFEYLMVDEAQDLNPVLIDIVNKAKRPAMIVGDPWQCLPPGEMILTPTGYVPIETVRRGDMVMAAAGGGTLRASRVTKTRTSKATALVEMRTVGGRIIRSTPNHVHFAGPPERTDGSEPVVRMAMCADGRRHVMTIEGSEASHRRALEAAGLAASMEADGSWRVRIGDSGMSVLNGFRNVALAAVPGMTVIETADLADGTSLALRQAGSCSPGMTIFVHDADGRRIVTDTIESVEEAAYDGLVHDIDVDGLHNFVAGGIVTHNSIYSFRGAISAMDEFRGRRFTLSRSFRFGPQIAAVANHILKQSTTPPDAPIVGNGNKVSRVREYQGTVKGRATILARTNLRLFESLVTIPHDFHVVGGVDDMISQVSGGYDLWKLSKGGPRKTITDPLVSRHKTWEDLMETGEAEDDPELMRLSKIVENYGDRIPEILTDLRRRNRANQDDARFIVSTAHKAKGREWEHVILLDDFPTLFELRTWLHKKRIKPMDYNQEINLTYVACTRAIETLSLSPAMYDEIAAGTGLPRI